VSTRPPPADDFHLRFWGTRGSLPAPRASTNRFGGNTPCVEVRAGGRLLILDAGSGIHPLGERLRRAGGPVQADIFFSHYHWDHIHGFPFFAPAFQPENRFSLWGAPRAGRSVEDILAGQMARPYFPVPLRAMRARFRVRPLRPGQTVRLGPVRLRTEALHHPGQALSFRIEVGGKSIVYATDHEHGSEADERLVRHAAGADILIYDAAYTEPELDAGRRGWGHSTWRAGVELARAAGVGRLLLFHHEPDRDDRELEAIERAARRLFPRTRAAREGRVHRP
jgi:phosphoribosyl 1,2-cyclic phosphodiesterase